MMTTNPAIDNYGLVLTGGGARGAYQAGVLAGIYEILEQHNKTYLFKTLTGSSAGAINVCLLADIIAKKKSPSTELENIWKNISDDQVFKTGVFSLTANGLNWAKTLALSGAGKPSHKILSLLDTAPLKTLLESYINFPTIQEAIHKKDIYSLAINSFNYSTGLNRTSFMAQESVKNWKTQKREGHKVLLTIEHVMASCAIPILFPPIKVNDCYFGDGGLRDYTPFSPSIKLGANKILAIGVRKAKGNNIEHCNIPTPARILSMLLNSVLLDPINLDYERILRINHMLREINGENDLRLQHIEVFMISPSVPLGKIAKEESGKLENLIKYYLRGLGNTNDTADIVSYINFEKDYTSRLFDLGKKDLYHQKDRFLEFSSLKSHYI